MRRSLQVVLCGFTTALACASTAGAGTVSLPNGAAEQFRDRLAVYRAGPGETNRLTLRGCYGRPCSADMEFTDESAPLTGDPFVNSAGCTPFGADLRGLLCRPVEFVDAYLGDRDDEFSNPSSYGGGRVWAGPGNDVVGVFSDHQAEVYGRAETTRSMPGATAAVALPTAGWAMTGSRSPGSGPPPLWVALDTTGCTSGSQHRRPRPNSPAVPAMTTSGSSSPVLRRLTEMTGRTPSKSTRSIYTTGAATSRCMATPVRTH